MALSERPSVIFASRTHNVVFSEKEQHEYKNYIADKDIENDVITIDAMEAGIDRISVCNRSLV